MVSAVSLNAILPLINKPVHTLETQVHCMQIIKNTVDFLNPGQTAIDVCDQPRKFTQNKVEKTRVIWSFILLFFTWRIAHGTLLAYDVWGAH